VTPGGVNVRNVAQTVIRQGYAVYEFDTRGGAALGGMAATASTSSGRASGRGASRASG
jgi:hypothetical protein